MKKTFYKNRTYFLSAILGALVLCIILTPGFARAADNTRYHNADILISSVLDYLQYPIPLKSHLDELPDHRISFKGVVPGASSTPIDDEVRFAAAWRFCEHLVPAWPSPPYAKENERKLTVTDIESIQARRSGMALMSVAMQECFAAVSYRTGCPRDSSDNFKTFGQGDSCYKKQKEMCDFLKNPDITKGLGIKSIDNGGPADYALDKCDQYGLSLAMYEKIFAYRCNDAAYVGNVLSRILSGPAAVEHALQFECPQAQQAYEAKLDREKERLLIAMQTLIQLQKTPPMPIDRQSSPVK